MKDLSLFKTHKSHKVCIYIKPHHFLFFKYLARHKFHNDFSKTLLYLLSKYQKLLYKIKISHIKKTMTITYQPTTKDYDKYNVYINPALWAKFQELRFYTGYSMSYLIRVMIEWEMQEEGEEVRGILQEKPELTEQEKKEIPPIHFYSYDLRVKVKYKTREVYMKFMDFY